MADPAPGPGYRFMECTEAACRFRYPVAVDDPRGGRCPSCGRPAQPAADARIRHDRRSAAVTAAGLETPKPDGRIIDLLVDNVRSVYNAGSIVRTADGAGVRHLYLCGITPTPDHPRLAKTALGAESAVAWSRHPNAVDLARSLRADGRALWALETGPGARSLYAQQPDAPCITLIVGNERAGVDPALLELSDAVVMLPMQGTKGSLNVATACGIALYVLRHQL